MNNSNKNVVYTVIVGDYDDLIQPQIISENWDYVCFTNNPQLKSDIWQIKEIPTKYNEIEDPKRKASLLKIEYYELFGNEYDIIVSIDGNILIRNNLSMILDKEWGINLSQPWDFAIFDHYERQCVYQEAVVVRTYKLDAEKTIGDHMEKYRTENYPKNNGLWETTILVRNNKSEKLKETCKIWSEEYRNGSRRDQLSVNYSFWKADKIGLFPQVNVVPRPRGREFGPGFLCLQHKRGHHMIRHYNK